MKNRALSYDEKMSLARNPTGILLGIAVLISVWLFPKLIFGFIEAVLRGTFGVAEGLLRFVSCLGYGLGILMLAGWLTRKEQRPFRSIGLPSIRHRSKEIFRGFLVGVLAFLAVLGAAAGSGAVTVRVTPEGISVGLLAQALVLLLGYAIQSAGEEVQYRGYAFQLFRQPWGLIGAIAAQAIVFVVLHIPGGLSWLGALNLLLYAVFAAYWALSENSLWGVSAAHTAWNWLMSTFFGGIISGKPSPGSILQTQQVASASDLLGGGQYGLEGSIFTTIIFIFLCYMAYQLYRSKQNFAESHTA